MLIKKPAVCGTLESSDVQITIRPNEGNGIRIELDSVVKTIFGDEIIRTVQEVLNEFEVRDADISLVDKGALDCVIRSRMQAGLKRTSLYASASSPVNMIQAAFYEEDCLVYDLEDSVSAAEKDSARFLVCNALRYHRPKDKYVVVRVNGIYSEYIEEDLEAVVRARPDAIRIPKVEYGKEVKSIASRISEIEKKAGIEEGSIKLWCNIESYMGVLNAREIAMADPRVEAMALGAEDFTASMGAVRTRTGMEVFYARNAVLLACREAGIDALDIVFSNINDMEGLKEDAALSRNLGFDGKTVIHPRQIEAVNACFAPSEKEVRYAVRVLQTLEEGSRMGKGVITLDGSMLDKPMELRARATLEKARAAGMNAGGDYFD